ncbi:hypothetical protein OROMI_018565 [Orobanche minor]
MATTAVSRWPVTGAAAQRDQPHSTTSSSRVQFGSTNFRTPKQLRVANAANNAAAQPQPPPFPSSRAPLRRRRFLRAELPSAAAAPWRRL